VLRPVDLALRRPKAHRPDLVVLCDVSGSVAEFARFSVMSEHASCCDAIFEVGGLRQLEACIYRIS
jgi:hypothetical protein